MTTGEKLSSFVTRHPHVAKFTAKLSMHHGLRGVRRTPPQPKLPPRPRMKLLLAVALSLVTTTAIFAELSGHYPTRKPAPGTSTAASTHCNAAGRAATSPPLRCRRRFCTHEANVGYFTPTNTANFAAAIPLRSNSSSTSSRRARGVQTRPATSTFKT